MVLQDHRCLQPHVVMRLDVSDESVSEEICKSVHGSVEEVMMAATHARHQWRAICQVANYSLTILKLNKASYKSIVKNRLRRGVLQRPGVAVW